MAPAAPRYFESGYNDSMIMRPYLTHGSSARYGAAGEKSRSVVVEEKRSRPSPDGNNVGGPSHAAARYTDCSTTRSEPSRSNSPNYKIIILRLAPPGNTRATRPPLLSPSASFAMFSAPLLDLPFRFFSPPPSPSPLLPRRHPICPVLVDPR